MGQTLHASFDTGEHRLRSSSRLRCDPRDDETFRVVADERGPALRWTATAWGSHTVAWHVFPHGSRRHPQAELEHEFVGNALLPPSHVLSGHAADQRL